jgi:hypothetical protein
LNGINAWICLYSISAVLGFVKAALLLRLPSAAAPTILAPAAAAAAAGL